MVSGSFAERDLQLKASYGSSPPCTRSYVACLIYVYTYATHSCVYTRNSLRCIHTLLISGCILIWVCLHTWLFHACMRVATLMYVTQRIHRYTLIHPHTLMYHTQRIHRWPQSCITHTHVPLSSSTYHRSSSMYHSHHLCTTVIIYVPQSSSMYHSHHLSPAEV